MKRFLTVLALAACGGGKAAHKDTTTMPVTAKSECAVMAEHVAGVVVTFKNPPKASKDDIAGVIETHCEADTWSADAKKCWSGISGEDDAGKCAKVLTEAQHQSVMADVKQRFGDHHHKGGDHGDAAGGGGVAPKGPPPPPESAPPPVTRSPAPAPARAPAPKAPAKGKAPVKSNDPCEGGE